VGELCLVSVFESCHSVRVYVRHRRGVYSVFFSLCWNAPGRVGLSGKGITGLSEAKARGNVGLRNGGRPLSPGFYSKTDRTSVQLRLSWIPTCYC
jgi:hypothetical protein